MEKKIHEKKTDLSIDFSVNWFEKIWLKKITEKKLD